MIPIANITGLILAGGAGRRVHGQDKGLLMWQGRPLVAHVHARLREQVGPLLVSCNRNREAYEAYCDRTVADSRDDFQGPLAGLEAAAEYVDTDFIVVVGCDMPQLPKDLVQRLTAPLARADDFYPDVAFAHDGTRAQYLSAAIRRESLGSLTEYLNEGHRAVRSWFGSRHCTIVDFSDASSSFANHNTLA